MMVQRDAAGSLRVSLRFPFLISPEIGGSRGLTRDRKDSPLFGGYDKARPCGGTFLDSRLRGNDRVDGGFRFALPALQWFPGEFETGIHASRHGACRGVKPLCVYSLPPKTGGSRGLIRAEQS